MQVRAYAEHLSGIKTELSRYSHLSVFNAALNYLQPSSGARGIESMPWVIMFLLKLSLQQRSGTLYIEASGFLRIANSIYRLGDLVVKETSPNVMFLMMRSMIIQQVWYQGQPIDSWRSIFLHKTLINRSYEKNNELFLKKTGVSLDDYYKLTMCIYSLVGTKPPNSVVRYPLGRFYSDMSPHFSDETLANFLGLVAVPFSRLAGYLQQERFIVKDSNPAEMYQETPLKNKPIIVADDALIIFNAGLCISGLRSIALESLKAEPGFTQRFGRDMENYIEDRLRLTALDVYALKDLKNIIPVKIGKIADFVVSDGEELLIFECKSIFPSTLMKCAFDPDHLFALLKDNFIKAIEQGQVTAAKLAASRNFNGRKARIIIVTLEDFFIYGGDFVTQHLNEEFERLIESMHGHLAVPMADVVYMTLKDLNILTEWLKDKPANTVFRFFDGLDAIRNKPGGARLTISHHIDEQIATKVYGPVGMRDVLDKSQAEIEALLSGNKRHWQGQHIYSFMLAVHRFKQLLANRLDW